MFFKRSDKRLVYLDSAATSLKPKEVIEAVVSFYQNYCANVHRGIYFESEKATEQYERVREKVGKFINVLSQEVIFVRNTTEAINLVARTWGEINIKKGSRILLSVMEHHSNLVPWQELAKKKGAKLIFLDINKDGQLELSALDKLLKGVSLIAISHVSNMLGTINPVAEITKKAHQAGARVLIDGAQAVPHMKVDVRKIGCDFYAFSGHKCLGPSGTGVLWMKQEIAQDLPPFLTGGGMVSKVTLNGAEYLTGSQKYEAGTPNIEGVIGLGAAIDYLKNVGMKAVRKHGIDLTDYALKKLSGIKDLAIYGPLKATARGSIISFNIEGVHPHDVASFLDREGIAVRAGYHCAMPIHQRLKIGPSVRISFYIYNTKADIDKLVASLKKVKRILKK